jgi:hypothetical protein
VFEGEAILAIFDGLASALVQSLAAGDAGLANSWLGGVVGVAVVASWLSETVTGSQ